MEEVGTGDAALGQCHRYGDDPTEFMVQRCFVMGLGDTKAAWTHAATSEPRRLPSTKHWNYAMALLDTIPHPRTWAVNGDGASILIPRKTDGRNLGCVTRTLEQITSGLGSNPDTEREWDQNIGMYKKSIGK